MGYPGTKYFGEHILVHEFSHNIMGALQRADPALHAQIQPAYDAAKAAGKYKGQYAINTVAEYFAEGTQGDVTSAQTTPHPATEDLSDVHAGRRADQLRELVHLKRLPRL